MSPVSSIVVWPISPAVPPAPSNSLPSITIPAPIPVASFRYTTLSDPRPAPQVDSASAPRLASFPTRTGRSSSSTMRSRGEVPAQPGRIAEDPTIPVFCTGPGMPIPTPITRSRSASRSSSRRSTSSAALAIPSSAS